MEYSDLRQMKCVPCRKGDPGVTDVELPGLLGLLPLWKRVDYRGNWILERTIRLQTYLDGARLVQLIADHAESEDHHPEIVLGWRIVTIRWWTHAIGGLHQNDFISAAKTDELVNAVVRDNR